MKKRKVCIMLVFIAIIIVILSIITSYHYFKIYNPLVALQGLYQVVVSEKEYVQIQDYPKVIIADSDMMLEDYMQELGYYEIIINEVSDGDESCIREFQIAENQAYIMQKDYKYYSLWEWRE